MGCQEAGRHVSVPDARIPHIPGHLPRMLTLCHYSSDADSDVLGDYVLALIRAETPEPELRLSAISNLEDFLQESTYWGSFDISLDNETVLIQVLTLQKLRSLLMRSSKLYAASPTSLSEQTRPVLLLPRRL